jgi:hypothetical protein
LKPDSEAFSSFSNQKLLLRIGVDNAVTSLNEGPFVVELKKRKASIHLANVEDFVCLNDAVFGVLYELLLP